MFGQLKDLYNLQKQAREMQNELKAQLVEGSSQDKKIVITINGNYELQKVSVDPSSDLTPAEIESHVSQAFNDAASKLKDILVNKFKGLM